MWNFFEARRSWCSYSFFILVADDWTRHARLAYGVDWVGAELCRVRVASLSRRAASDSARTMGSSVLARHEPVARVSAHNSAAGLSDCAAADDQRLRFALQRHFDGVCDFGLGAGDGLSRACECLGTISAVGSRGVALLSGDEFADGASGAPA